MVEFQRPSVECMIVNVTYMNQKATALTDFNSIPVVPEYVEVEATGFASNFLPGAQQSRLPAAKDHHDQCPNGYRAQAIQAAAADDVDRRGTAGTSFVGGSGVVITS